MWAGGACGSTLVAQQSKGEDQSGGGCSHRSDNHFRRSANPLSTTLPACAYFSQDHGRVRRVGRTPATLGEHKSDGRSGQARARSQSTAPALTLKNAESFIFISASYAFNARARWADVRRERRPEDAEGRCVRFWHIDRSRLLAEAMTHLSSCWFDCLICTPAGRDACMCASAVARSRGG